MHKRISDCLTHRRRRVVRQVLTEDSLDYASDAEAAFAAAPTPKPAASPGSSSPSPADRAAGTAPQASKDGGADSSENSSAEITNTPDPASADDTQGSNGTSTPEKPSSGTSDAAAESGSPKPATPKPSMMAPRRKLRSKYVPLPEEVWTSAGFQSPFDVGQQYASWWFENAASAEQRDQAHLLSGGGLPPEIDRPLLQFACETLHEYTLTESQRVNLRDGFHSGIRGVLITVRRNES